MESASFEKAASVQTPPARVAGSNSCLKPKALSSITASDCVSTPNP